MVYNEKFIVVVKCNGKILREKDNVVSLPFGANYSLLFKNLDSRKSQFTVSIDGKDVLDNSELILKPNTNSELLGFMKGNHVHNKFKFIQKTKEISDYRGDEIDDGIIRVEFAFEKEKAEQWSFSFNEGRQNVFKNHIYHVYNPPIFGSNDFNTYGAGPVESSPIFGSNDFNTYDSYTCSTGSAESSSVVCDGADSSIPHEDEGITVQGDKTHQSFTYASIGETESSNIIILRLRGYKPSGSTISKPITIKTKLICSTCGTKSASSACFCSKCGTNLEI